MENTTMSEVHTDMETEMNVLLWEVEKAAISVGSVTSMITEYKDSCPASTDINEHIESTVWLCQELARYQRSLIRRLEEGVGILHGRKAFINPLEDISSLSESMERP